MQIKIQIEGGHIVFTTAVLDDVIHNLNDGTYIISFDMVNPQTTIEQLRKAYFDMVDQVAKDTGNGRYVIHDEYKQFRNIESTKGMNIDEWRAYLKEFPFWIFNKIGIMI